MKKLKKFFSNKGKLTVMAFIMSTIGLAITFIGVATNEQCPVVIPIIGVISMAVWLNSWAALQLKYLDYKYDF